jgi:hypothetical protein
VRKSPINLNLKNKPKIQRRNLVLPIEKDQIQFVQANANLNIFARVQSYSQDINFRKKR